MDTATCSKCGRTIGQNKQIFSQESILCWKHEQEIIRNEKKLKEKEQTKNLIKVGVIVAAVIVMIIVIIAIYQHFTNYSDIAGTYELDDVSLSEDDIKVQRYSTDTDCIIENSGKISFVIYDYDKGEYVRKYGRLKKSDNTVYTYGIKEDDADYEPEEDAKYLYYFDYPIHITIMMIHIPYTILGIMTTIIMTKMNNGKTICN